MSNIMINALFPCLTFNKIVANLQNSMIKEIGVFALTTILIFITGFGLACIVMLVSPIPKHWRFGFIFAGIFPNIIDLPIAYVQSMAGSVFTQDQVNKAIALNCVFLAGMQFVMQNCGAFQIIGLDFKKAEEQLSTDMESIQPVTSDKECDMSEFDVIELVGEEQTLPPRRYSKGHSACSVRSCESGRSLRSVQRTKSQTMQSVIDEYSEVERIRSMPEDVLGKTMSKTDMVGLNENDAMPSDSEMSKFIVRYKLGWLTFMLQNFATIPSGVLVTSFVVAMIPWLKALFVRTDNIQMPNAPDGLPPLNFVMDFTSYLGSASVPTGLLLLGGTLARLEVREIPKGFWKSVLAMVTARLVLMPVLGMLWTKQIFRSGIITDDMSRFLISIAWSCPSSTAQVYFTALYTPLEGPHEQMDCLAIFLLAQYPVLCITLPTVLSYVMKVSLGF